MLRDDAWVLSVQVGQHVGKLREVDSGLQDVHGADRLANALEMQRAVVNVQDLFRAQREAVCAEFLKQRGDGALLVWMRLHFGPREIARQSQQIEDREDMLGLVPAGHRHEQALVVDRGQHLPHAGKQPHLDAIGIRNGLRIDFAKRDRKSTRLNSSHQIISYAVFCLKKKKKKKKQETKNNTKE